MLSKNIVVKFPSFEQQSFFSTYRVTFDTMVISVVWIIGPLNIILVYHWWEEFVWLLHSYSTCSARRLFLHMTDLMILRCITCEKVNFGFVILFSLAKNFEESYIESGGTSSSFCNKIFASWDYCISDENTAKVKSQNIVQTVRVSVKNMNEGVRC